MFADIVKIGAHDSVSYYANRIHIKAITADSNALTIYISYINNTTESYKATTKEIHEGNLASILSGK